MGFLDEIRKKNKLAKSLVSNGLAPNFDVAVKMVEAKMRVESGAQDPIGESTPSSVPKDVMAAVQENMSLAEQKKASITQFDNSRIHKTVDMSVKKQVEEAKRESVASASQNTSGIDVQKILSENTKFITEQFVDFRTQMADLAATMEVMQKEMVAMKRKIVQLENRPAAPSAPVQASTQEEVAAPIPSSKPVAKSHPRSPSADSGFKPEDVAIDKMFNFSGKKF